SNLAHFFTTRLLESSSSNNQNQRDANTVYGWPASRIFLLGFSHGGTVALDFALFSPITNLGGVISISAGLVDGVYEGLGGLEGVLKRMEWNRECRVLVTVGSTDEVLEIEGLKKQISRLKSHAADAKQVELLVVPGKGHAMPRTEFEMRAIMTFFGKHLALRNMALESMADVTALQSSICPPIATAISPDNFNEDIEAREAPTKAGDNAKGTLKLTVHVSRTAEDSARSKYVVWRGRRENRNQHVWAFTSVLPQTKIRDAQICPFVIVNQEPSSHRRNPKESQTAHGVNSGIISDELQNEATIHGFARFHNRVVLPPFDLRFTFQSFAIVWPANRMFKVPLRMIKLLDRLQQRPTITWYASRHLIPDR
ncbi:hypothetical protein HK102_010744, partial [Quaeritorhiza haematococci]